MRDDKERAELNKIGISLEEFRQAQADIRAIKARLEMP